ncbi:MAG: hypothetical protein ACTSQZ_04040, partial [Candidatus Thorarchaeota archaeon]
KVRELLRKAENHILKLKMVALEESDFFDDRAALSSVFHESYHAKRIAKEIQQILRETKESEFLEDLWACDDERAFEAWNAWIRILRRRKGLPIHQLSGTMTDDIFVFADCETQGNRFIYSLTIKNESKYVLTNLTATVVAYPKECMKAITNLVTRTTRIKAGGLDTSRFIFTPSKDCVQGRIVCSISYIDHKDQLHSVHVKPYFITSVCDLLRPYESTSDVYEDTLRNLFENKQELNLEWNADVLISKAASLLPTLNFYVVTTESKKVANTIVGRVRGFAIGKYTGNRVAVDLHITGHMDEDKSTARIVVFGDDEAMLPTTIQELLDGMDSWICNECGALLNPEQIMKLESKESLSCRYCGSTLTIDLYSKSSRTSRYSSMKAMSKDIDLKELSAIEESLFDGEKSTELDTTENAQIVQGVTAVRGCELTGGAFHYKVKVTNGSLYVITNVVVNIIGYPEDCLKFEGDLVKSIPRIEIGGFRSPEFKFIPTKDCVEGRIIVIVSFLDYKEGIHSIHVVPFTIRSVCDLLTPLESSPVDFKAILGSLSENLKEYEIEWNPSITLRKVREILPTLNFYVVDMEEQTTDEIFTGNVSGFAEGKYTKKHVAAIISVKGKKNGHSSSLSVRVLGEDITMLPTAIKELRDGIDTWSCLHCKSKLTEESVVKIKASQVIVCKHCNHTLTLELYR